jgi:hypothetical protein
MKSDDSGTVKEKLYIKDHSEVDFPLPTLFRSQRLAPLSSVDFYVQAVLVSRDLLSILIMVYN